MMSVALRLYLSTLRSDGAVTPTFDLVRPDGHVMWFHAASVRDAHAALELAGRLRVDAFGATFVITAAAPVPIPRDWDDVFFCQLAGNSPPHTDAFLAHWRPNQLVWVGETLDPGVLMPTAKHGMKALLVNGRIDRKQRRQWRFYPGAIASMVGVFDHILTADTDAEKWFQRVVKQNTKIDTVGFLQEDTVALPCSETDRSHLAEGFGGRPVWLAAGISIAEEKAIIEAHVRATRRAHKLLLIVVPDDPARGVGLANDLGARGIRVLLRSSGQEPRNDTQVYIADGDDGMGLWYRLASVSFLGHSMIEDGGLNPFEAAALGSGIIHGPHLGQFATSFQRLYDAEASIMINSAGELSRAVEVLQAPDKVAELAHKAWLVCTSGAEVSDTIHDLLLDKIDMFEEAV